MFKQWLYISYYDLLCSDCTGAIAVAHNVHAEL